MSSWSFFPAKNTDEKSITHLQAWINSNAVFISLAEPRHHAGIGTQVATDWLNIILWVLLQKLCNHFLIFLPVDWTSWVRDPLGVVLHRMGQQLELERFEGVYAILLFFIQFLVSLVDVLLEREISLGLLVVVSGEVDQHAWPRARRIQHNKLHVGVFSGLGL